MPISKSQIITIGATLAIIWVINNVDALSPIKDQMNY